MGGLLRHAGLLVVLACVAVSIVVSVVPLQPKSGAPNLGARLQAPAWLGGRGDFLLGSDQLGRELLYRLLGGIQPFAGKGHLLRGKDIGKGDQHGGRG